MLVGRIVGIPMRRCSKQYRLHLACIYIPGVTTGNMNRIKLRILSISPPSHIFRRDIWVSLTRVRFRGISLRKC